MNPTSVCRVGAKCFVVHTVFHCEECLSIIGCYQHRPSTPISLLPTNSLVQYLKHLISEIPANRRHLADIYLINQS
jgi:hypothetical protein